MEKQLDRVNDSINLDANYKDFLKDIKERLKSAQIRAALAANQELIKFYWELGREILAKQKAYKWGEQFLKQFSQDMKAAFPEMTGFSVRNLQRMRQFATLYPTLSFATQAVSQLPWGHILRLIQMVKNDVARDWYAKETVKNGWSRSVLEMQIESALYERQGCPDKKLSNYHEHLPAPQSDLANQILKDPYNFDFLTIQGKASERAIEDALVTHVRNFLLELGQGFAFVGSQVPLTIDGQEFFVDLLFYHLQLRCFVVIELKAGQFKPEHTGQLGFYLAVVDDLMRKDGDNPTIGMLLCKSKNKVVAEYALRGMKAPIGVSEFMLSKAVPEELAASLPSVEQLEAKLSEIQE